MNIEVKSITIKKSPKDWAEELQISVVNEVVVGLSKEIQEGVAEATCDIHKEKSKGLITIKADLKKSMIISKTNFCCNDFEDSINIT